MTSYDGAANGGAVVEQDTATIVNTGTDKPRKHRSTEHSFLEKSKDSVLP
jgi:hypothetical protein